MMLTKTCKKCGEEKFLECFRIDRNKYGRRASCRTCEYKSDKRRLLNPENERRRYLQWRTLHVEHARELYREWFAENTERRRLYNLEWHKKNPGKHSEYNKKRRSIPKGRLNASISISICNSLHGNKNGRHWEDLVGYTLEKLKSHLEKQFSSGMNWDNYGVKGWTIDHKIPIKAFHFETSYDFDFKRCWAINNLRPMWHIENIKKKDKLEKPFQPALLV